MKKRSFLFTIICSAALSAAAQSPRVWRTEFAPFDTRRDALADDSSKTAHHTVLSPVATGDDIYSQTLDVPASWNDFNAYLHIENAGSAYTLAINGTPVAEVEEAFSPADFMISPWLRQGANTLELKLRPSRHPELQEGLAHVAGGRFSGSRLFVQRKLRIDDFTVGIVPDSTERYGILNLDAVVANDFNYPETAAVGYDIYSPDGKLIDYGVRELSVDGRSRDTLRIRADIYGAYSNEWGGNKGAAPLYSVMLYIKRNGVPCEYIPFKTGFGRHAVQDGKFVRNGRPVDIVRQRYNAPTDRTAAEKEIAAMKKRGVNTLIPDYPQPRWFYDICDRAGIFVIDRAAINAPHNRDDRSVGGTPSNDPSLLGQYEERVKAMYFRSRNHPCVIGFMLGGEAGNGYNMYKAYRYLKSVEPQRPVIYENAAGEWNSDM